MEDVLSIAGAVMFSLEIPKCTQGFNIQDSWSFVCFVVAGPITLKMLLLKQQLIIRR